MVPDVRGLAVVGVSSRTGMLGWSEAVMLRRSSYIVAAASVAAQAGPAAVLLCDEMVREMGVGRDVASEREILMARAAARMQGGEKKGLRMPRVSLKGIVAGWGWRKPRLAA